MIRLLTKQQAAEIVGLNPATLMRLAKDGNFPQPIKLGDKDACHVRFDYDEIAEWLASRRHSR